MNRLVVTILLVLAFAVSFAKLAFADTTSPRMHHKPAAKAADTDSSTASTDSANATPATPVLPSTLKITDICGTDKDCLSQEFTQSKDGKETDYRITNAFNNVTGQFTATVKIEACDCAIDQAMAQVTVTTDIKPTQTDDLRAFAKEAIAKAVKNLDAYNARLDAEAEKKRLLDTCTYAKANFTMVDGKAVWDKSVPFEKPKVKKSKYDPDDFEHVDYTPSELDPQMDCQEKSLKNLEKRMKNEKSDDYDKDLASVKVLVRNFDKRYAQLRAKSAQGTMTEADLEEFKNMNDFQNDVIAKNDTMNEISAEYFVKAAQDANTDFKAKLAKGDLSNMDKAAALKYASDIELARATMGNLDTTDKNYASKITFLNGLSKDPATDFMSATKRATDALPAGSKLAAAAGDSSLTSYLNQLQGTTDATSGKTAQATLEKYIKDATGKYLVRGDGTNGAAGDLYSSIMVKEPPLAQCFTQNSSIASNYKVCPDTRKAANFRLATVGGSGLVASTSATNYNTPANLAARGSNTMTSFTHL